GAKRRRSFTPRIDWRTRAAWSRRCVTEAWWQRSPTERPRRSVGRRETSTSSPGRTAAMDPYSRVGSHVMARIRFDRLPTERQNPQSRSLDRLAPTAIARLMNRADGDALRAVGRAAPTIGRVVTALVGRLERGGRLIFVGAGTSGRLGVIEAAECPPTFNTSPRQVQAVMAGGRRAVFRSVEGSGGGVRGGAHPPPAAVRPDHLQGGFAASGRASLLSC